MNVPERIRVIMEGNGSGMIGNAIADMLDRDYDIDKPGKRNEHLRIALAELKLAAGMDKQ